MRVSTAMLYESSTRAMLERQAELLRTQQQLSTGRRVLQPADDPLAASQSLALEQARDTTSQYAANVSAARASLALAESTLGEVGGVLQAAREVLVQAGDASLSDADRRSLATDLRSRFAELLGAANRRDGQGRSLFAGFAEDRAPFVDTGLAVAYAGDHGVRELQVAAARNLATGASGAEVFQGIAQGNGAFVTGLGAANAGDAFISAGGVASAAALTGHDYTVDFTVLGTTTTYTVTDATLGVVVSSGNPYRSGASLVVDGQRFEIHGSPAGGDRFTLAPAGRQDLFTPLREAIDALAAPLAAPADRGRFATTRERALASLDQGLERVLEVRARFGAGLRELDALEGAHAAGGEQLEAEISRLTSLDYAQAVSDFSREQKALEAAQKAFAGVARLTLFDQL